MIHIWRSWKLSDFQYPPPPCPSTSKILPPPWPWTSNFKRNSPQMITNQLKKSIIQEWLLYVIRSFLQVGFRFQYQLINLVWLLFDFFSFSWSLTICFFMALYCWVCNYPKISRNVFYLKLFTFFVLICNQPALFAQYENVNKPWNNNRIVHGYERSQNQNKTKPRHIQIYHALYCSIQWNKTHKQCNGVIKGWPLKEGFLSIIYWCLAQHDVWSPRKSNFL